MRACMRASFKLLIADATNALENTQGRLVILQFVCVQTDAAAHQCADINATSSFHESFHSIIRACYCNFRQNYKLYKAAAVARALARGTVLISML